MSGAETDPYGHGPKKSKSEIKLLDVNYRTDNTFQDGSAQAIFERNYAPEEIKDLTEKSLAEIPRS